MKYENTIEENFYYNVKIIKERKYLFTKTKLYATLTPIIILLT